MAAIELTAAQVKELRSLDAAITDLNGVLRRAEAAGLDVTDLQRRLAEANARRQGLLQQFTPGLNKR